MSKITKAEVKTTELWPGMPGASVVVVDFDDDRTDVILFEFFSDEIQFTGDEFVGKTEDEARALHFRKDKEWLTS